MNGKKAFEHMNYCLFSLIPKINILILALAIIAQPQQDTVQIKLPPEHSSTEKRIYIGNQLLKAGLITAIVGSVFLTISILVIFSPGHYNSSFKTGLELGGIGIINVGISIPLTISGAAIKSRFKSMKNKAKKSTGGGGVVDE